MCPFPFAGSFHALDLGHSHGRATVHDRDADVDFRDLTIGISRDDPIARQFEAVHLRLDATSYMIAGPPLPQPTSQALCCSQRLVSPDRRGTVGFPHAPISADRDDGLGAARKDRSKTPARI